MNLIEHLELENSKKNWHQVIDYVGKDPIKFRAIVQLFIHGEPHIVQRIGQPFGSIVERHPPLILPYLDELIDYLKTNPIDAVKRNCMRSFQWITIPDDQLGDLFDIGMLYLRTQAEPIAVKAFSMTVLRQICTRYPELTNEVIFQLEIILKGETSAGVKNRGEKELKKLKAIIGQH